MDMYSMCMVHSPLGTQVGQDDPAYKIMNMDVACTTIVKVHMRASMDQCTIHDLCPLGAQGNSLGFLAEGLWVQNWKSLWDGSGREFDLPTSKLEIVHFKIKTLISTIYIQCMLASVCFSHSKEGPCRMREAVVDIGKAQLRASPTEYH